MHGFQCRTYLRRSNVRQIKIWRIRCGNSPKRHRAMRIICRARSKRPPGLVGIKAVEKGETLVEVLLSDWRGGRHVSGAVFKSFEQWGKRDVRQLSARQSKIGCATNNQRYAAN